MKLKKRKINTIYVFIILVISILLNIYYETNSLYHDELQRIDKNLYKTAKNIPFYLGNDYNFKNMNKNSYNENQILKTSKKLIDIAHINGVDYLYTIIIDDNMPTYTSIGGASEEYLEYFKKKNLSQFYWFTFEDVEDDSIQETINIFNSEDIVYLDSSDNLGTYRSIYIISLTEDGRKYISGADMTITNLNKLVFKKVSYQVLHTLLLLLILVLFVLIISENIKEKKKIKENFIKSINYDALTDVLKRKEGIERLNKIIKPLSFEKKQIFVGLFDIMDMTYINEEFGTKIGDDMIKKLADVLKITFRETDEIIRLNGDQFLVVLKEFSTNQTIKQLEKRFESSLKKYDFLKKRELHITVRKVFLKWDDETDLNSMLRVLFEKLRIIKGNTQKEIALMEFDIQRGLHKNEFVVYYQPKVNIITKNIEFEALMRWNHKEKGLIPPIKFISIAEKSSLIISLTEFLIKQVRKDIEFLKTKVSVNISPTHFNKEFFLEEMLEKYDNLDGIEFELTEDNFIDEVDNSIKKIEILKSKGVNFLIDDFGTGYSSLSSLAKLPITTLKIDRSFVVNMFKTNRDMNVLKTIIQLGQNLNLKIVVEGVEELKEINLLADLGVSIFQGYYFGKPEKLETVLKKIKNKTYLMNLKK
ncbi:MAG: bifunctional diguanylate cyclase/phosphodiesterase [Psychrilyobacter sp.]|uniref:EAL domain-containing protein n=1 Tax=Psychrilyobacter sp. TaxID=2586924 RepID=UPI003C75CF17